MKKALCAMVLFLVIAGAFLAGSWYSQRGALNPRASEARKILHYVDPMNPAHTSDRPGVAPCGMPMEPVYSDGGEGRRSSLPPGTVDISPDKQQIMGVAVSRVEKTDGTHTLRMLGRVAPDEKRVYRVNAGIDGVIREVSPVTTGDHVKKDQILATFLSPNALTTIQLFMRATDTLQRTMFSEAEGNMASELASGNIRQRVDQLHNIGMSARQMQEIAETKKFPESIRILAPADGVVLSRNVSPDQKFDRGVELYQIADLTRVWILADVFESEARYLKPGMTVKASLPQGKSFQAKVSAVRQKFDPATRTLKVRLEAENPGDILRPDMFMDVEIPVTLPSAVTVPVDAILDSGLKKTVFVDLGNGYFERREVETGWRFGKRVEITKGLEPGESIAISGTFLVDSESRMRAPAQVTHARTNKDIVCGMNVDETKAKAAGKTKEYKGKTYFFCSDQCRDAFNKDPKRFIGNDLTKGDKMASAGHSHVDCAAP